MFNPASEVAARTLYRGVPVLDNSEIRPVKELKGAVKVASTSGVRGNSPLSGACMNASLPLSRTVILQKDIRGYLGIRRLQTQRGVGDEGSTNVGI